MSILQEYIKLVLNESLAGAEKLKKYIRKRGEDAQYYAYMSDINKIGINPKFSYGNPIGIYSYILDEETFNDITIGNQEFATDRPYIFVIRPREDANVLYTSKDMSSEKVKEYRRKISKFVFGSEGDDFLEILKDYGNQSRYDFNLGRLWNAMRLATKNVIVWRKLLKHLGIDAIIDDAGTGMLHPAEQKQAWFSDVKSLEVVDIIYSRGGTKLSIDNFSLEAKMKILGKIDAEKLSDIGSGFFYSLEKNILANIEIGKITPKDLKKHGLKRLYDEIYKERKIVVILPDNRGHIFDTMNQFTGSSGEIDHIKKTIKQKRRFPDGKYEIIDVWFPPDARGIVKKNWEDYFYFPEYYKVIEEFEKNADPNFALKLMNRLIVRLKEKLPDIEISKLRTNKEKIIQFIEEEIEKEGDGFYLPGRLSEFINIELGISQSSSALIRDTIYNLI